MKTCGLRTILAAAAVCAALPAFGLSCVGRSYDEAEAKTMFGPAREVFVGTLASLAKEIRKEQWRWSAEGVFSVERTFKGTPLREQRVRVNPDIAPGARYLVYANEEKGELRADAACWPRAIALPEARKHLAYLESMPAPGAGGEVYLGVNGLIRLPLRDAVKRYTLELASGGTKVAIVTDDEGKALVKDVPPGAYRIATTPPPGYKFDCHGQSCDALTVHDRSRNQFNVSLMPLGLLKIEVRDADGKRVDLRAEFKVYEAGSGRFIGRFSPFMSYMVINDAPFAAIDRIVPGEYVLGLALTEAALDGASYKVARQTVVFDGGAPSAAAAPRITVKPGDNVVAFTLPRNMKPIRTQLEFEAPDTYFSPSLKLVIESTHPYTEDAGYYFSRPRGHPDMNAFWSLPGQTWKIGAGGSYTVEGGTYGDRVVSPTQDGTLRIKVIKAR